MTATEYLLKKLNPKSGTLKTGVMNNEYVPELLEEYARIYHKHQVKLDKSGVCDQIDEFGIGYKAGWAAAMKSAIRKLEENSLPPNNQQITQNNRKMKTVTGPVSEDDFEEKHFYFQAQIKVLCPNCKTEQEIDFSNDACPEYMKVGKLDTLFFSCNECYKDWEMPFILKSVDVTLNYDDEKITEPLD